MKMIQYLLLIEPVWNRNRHNEGADTIDGFLLIEPVWNRNPHFCISQAYRLTFNRTSMESKQC